MEHIRAPAVGSDDSARYARLRAVVLSRGRTGGELCGLFKIRGDPPSPEDSARAHIGVIVALTLADNGKFIDTEGITVPF